MANRCRPLSQQFAPDEYTLPVTSIPREQLSRKVTRHEPLPEKEYPTLTLSTPSPPELYAPDESHLISPPSDFTDTEHSAPNIGDHAPSDPEIPFTDPDHDCEIKYPTFKAETPNRARDGGQTNTSPVSSNLTGRPTNKKRPSSPIVMGKDTGNNHGHESPVVHDKNGDLPYDQLIPLEELPRDQHPYGRYIGQPPPPTVFDSQPLLRRPKRRRTTNGNNGNYNSKASRCIGITLIIIGICEIGLNVAGILLQHFFRTSSEWNIVYFLGPGLWCSIFFILCGTFGVISARNKVTWAIVTHLVASTLASVFGFLLLAMCGWGVHREIQLGEQLGLQLPSLIVVCVMAFGALIAIPLSIYASVICCNLFCRKWKS